MLARMMRGWRRATAALAMRQPPVPRVARWLLRLAAPEHRDALLADLDEEAAARAARRNRRRAPLEPAAGDLASFRRCWSAAPQRHDTEEESTWMHGVVSDRI